MRENGVLKKKKKQQKLKKRLRDGPHIEKDIALSTRVRASHKVSFANSTSCSKFITADCLRVQYGITNGTTAAPGNELGIYQDLNDHYSTADLDRFLADVYPYMNIPKGTYPENRLIDGAIGSWEDLVAAVGSDYGGIGLESTLDLQASIPLVWPQKTVLFQTNDEYYETEQPAGFLNTFLDAIDGSYCTFSQFNFTGDCTDPSCADPVYPNPHAAAPLGYQGQHQCGVYQPTNVISISYSAVEDLIPNNYNYRQCNEYMKLGLQGVTVVSSSGSHGVASQLGCIGSTARPNVGTIFAPSFPQNCPYVLTVGGTELRRRNPKAPPVKWEILQEVATTQFASGGGFSNNHYLGDFQTAAVQAYLDNVTLPFGSYDTPIFDADFSNITDVNQVFYRGGRAYPDVAAVAANQLVLYDGEYYTVSGTSLASPLWGSMLTLINEERIAAGKGTLGWIHPTLYSHPEVFNDITEGNNNACPSPNQKATWGFPAAPGWDPVTGLGSPNFPALKSLLVGL
ncbi:peptidase S8/S53 domain-containing protein [Trichoderma ceciliae]